MKIGEGDPFGSELVEPWGVRNLQPLFEERFVNADIPPALEYEGTGTSEGKRREKQ
jgi:hypothetical protein